MLVGRVHQEWITTICRCMVVGRSFCFASSQYAPQKIGNKFRVTLKNVRSFSTRDHQNHIDTTIKSSKIIIHFLHVQYLLLVLSKGLRNFRPFWGSKPMERKVRCAGRRAFTYDGLICPDSFHSKMGRKINGWNLKITLPWHRKSSEPNHHFQVQC